MTPTGPLEKDVEKRVVALYRQAGCWVESRSQGYRPGGKGHGSTRQTLGIPDLMLWPTIGRGPTFLLPWLHESKRQGGVQTVEQWEYEDRCKGSGMEYVLGGTHEALQQLIKRGLWTLPAGITVESVAGPPTIVTREKRKSPAPFPPAPARETR